MRARARIRRTSRARSARRRRVTPINKSKKAGHTLVLAVGGKAAAPWVAPTRRRQLRAAERLPGHVREETLLDQACHSGGRPSDRNISRSSIRPVGPSACAQELAARTPENSARKWRPQKPRTSRLAGFRETEGFPPSSIFVGRLKPSEAVLIDAPYHCSPTITTASSTLQRSRTNSVAAPLARCSAERQDATFR